MMPGLPRIPWYTRFLLLFHRTRVVQEIEDDGWVVEVHMKKHRGKIYVMHVGRYIPPPVHYNSRCKGIDI